MIGINRRLFLGSGLAFASGVQAQRSGSDDVGNRLAALRDSLGKGARIGVMAIDTGSEGQVAFNADSRFAMCSTFKLPLAAFVLRLADRRALSLSEQLAFGRGDPLENSPLVAANLKHGRLSIAALAAAAVRQSDNSAANLLLRRTGGPEALTRFIRACGDKVTRCDRYEMALNSNADGDPRDTTTPAAMATLTRTLLLGPVLSSASSARLTDWMRTSVAKPDRLKAGFPRGWPVGHKPGTGRGGAVNDVAIAWPPGRPPIIVAAYMSGGTADNEARAATHRAIARLVAQKLGGF
jgi:beta-lactamase class A